MQLFSRDRDQQYCVKAFHKIRGPRQCNCYRVQVNNDFAQNTGRVHGIAPLYECVGTYEIARSRKGKRRTTGWGVGGRRHKTSKRFIKYHTAEHCYDTSMQILFCVHEGAINDPPLPPLSFHPPPLFLFPVPLYARISFSPRSFAIENAAWERSIFVPKRTLGWLIRMISSGDLRIVIHILQTRDAQILRVLSFISQSRDTLEWNYCVDINRDSFCLLKWTKE